MSLTPIVIAPRATVVTPPLCIELCALLSPLLVKVRGWREQRERVREKEGQGTWRVERAGGPLCLALFVMGDACDGMGKGCVVTRRLRLNAALNYRPSCKLRARVQVHRYGYTDPLLPDSGARLTSSCCCNKGLRLQRCASPTLRLAGLGSQRTHAAEALLLLAAARMFVVGER